MVQTCLNGAVSRTEVAGSRILTLYAPCSRSLQSDQHTSHFTPFKIDIIHQLALREKRLYKKESYSRFVNLFKYWVDCFYYSILTFVQLTYNLCFNCSHRISNFYIVCLQLPHVNNLQSDLHLSCLLCFCYKAFFHLYLLISAKMQVVVAYPFTLASSE